ncbi:MAG: universal stress protein [Candidatus Promineifilaceae bacterium]|jgi:K+-sensing histidine kinase KdpD
MMNEVVCATRGGEASRAVQMAAIEQAKANNSPLVFLYVVSPEAVKDVEPSLKKAVIGEQIWLGKVILKVAEDRAEREGVRATKVIREGDVRQEICSYLTEKQARLLLLGASRSTTFSVFGDDPAERLASSIHENTGVDVAIVRPGREDSDSYYSYLVPA